MSAFILLTEKRIHIISHTEYASDIKNDTERNTAIKLIKKGKMSLEEIADCDFMLEEIEKKFNKSGGLTLETNDDLIAKIKLEEKHREMLNLNIKDL